MGPFQIPGKLFLIGEYSVITGGKALLAAVKPAFEYATNEGDAVSIHAESPVGKYLEQTAQKVSLKLYNPGLGAGFGTSTAELIAAIQGINGVLPETESILKWYQKEFPNASGADLATQLEALRTTKGLFEVSEKTQIKSLHAAASGRSILLFQAPVVEKVPTHEDLKRVRPEISLEVANAFVERAKVCFTSGGSADWHVLTEWANWLSTFGLESAFAQKVRSKIIQVPGVLGAKGCGAGLNDVMLVVVDSNAGAETQLLAQLLAIAQEFEMKFLGNLEERLWKA